MEERFEILSRHDLCDVFGGSGVIPEETLARLIGRILGAAAKAIYDLLTGGGSEPEPEPEPPKADPAPAS